MVCDGYTEVWDLKSGELLKLDGARGTTLRVNRGTLWLTQEHDTRDFVLNAGDVYTIDRAGLTLVEAQNNASVCVLAHYVDAIRVPRSKETLVARLRNWAHSAVPSLERRWAPYV